MEVSAEELKKSKMDEPKVAKTNSSLAFVVLVELKGELERSCHCLDCLTRVMTAANTCA